MRFSPVISKPVFAREAPDMAVLADNAGTVTLKVTADGDSWETRLSTRPDGSGGHRADIRLKDILSSVVTPPAPDIPGGSIYIPTVTLSASNDKGEQASTDIPVAFGNLTGRSPQDFLGKWLTSREQTCRTYAWARESIALMYSPAMLGWTLNEAIHLEVRVKIYRASGQVYDTQISSIEDTNRGVYVWVDASYNRLMSACSPEDPPVAWDFYYILSGIEDEEAVTLKSYPQRFILFREDSRVKEFIFTNCFGMEDRVFAEGVSRRSVEGGSSTFVNGGMRKELSNDAETVFEAFSGQLADRRAVFHWHDFLMSSARMLYSPSDGSLTGIVVDSHDSETEDFTVGGVSFSFRLAVRYADYPEDLCESLGDYDPEQQYGALVVGDDPEAVTPPADDLFFLKHRLSEFPALTLSSALLLLSQTPATNAWGSITLGALGKWLNESSDGSINEKALWKLLGTPGEEQLDKSRIPLLGYLPLTGGSVSGSLTIKGGLTTETGFSISGQQGSGRIDLKDNGDVRIKGERVKKRMKVMTGRAIPLQPMVGDVYYTNCVKITAKDAKRLGSVDISGWSGARRAVNSRRRTLSVAVPDSLTPDFFDTTEEETGVCTVYIYIGSTAADFRTAAQFWRVTDYRADGRSVISSSDLFSDQDMISCADVATSSPWVRVSCGLKYVTKPVMRPTLVNGSKFRLTDYMPEDSYGKKVKYRALYNRAPAKRKHAEQPFLHHRPAVRITYNPDIVDETGKRRNGVTYLLGLGKKNYRKVHLRIYARHRNMWYLLLETTFKGGAVKLI